MNVILINQENYGKIKNVYDFGAGHIVEIAIYESNKSIMLPFTKDYFPLVDTKAAIATLILPTIIS